MAGAAKQNFDGKLCMAQSQIALKMNQTDFTNRLLTRDTNRLKLKAIVTMLWIRPMRLKDV